MTLPPSATDTSGTQLVTLRLRVPAFSATSVCLGVVAHVAAGGRPPGAAMVLLLLAVVIVTSASLTRRERGLPAIMLAVGLVQVGMHLALLPGHESPHAPAMSNPPSMLLAHAGAVVALTWWLRRGEAASWRVAVRIWRRHVVLPSIPVLSSVSLRDLTVSPCRVGLSRGLAVLIPVRGPPKVA